MRTGRVHFPAFQQLQSLRFAPLLPLCGEFAIRQVDGISPLVRGKPDAAI